MITKDDMMGVLLQACPSFTPRWEEFQEEWREETVDLPHYLILADFARHVISMLERQDIAKFPDVFSAIELLHVEGDHYVREAATVGLLESLQNLNLHTATKPEQFRQYLGPESARWWNKLYDFWDNGTLMTD